MAEGMTGYIVKPYSKAALLETRGTPARHRLERRRGSRGGLTPCDIIMITLVVYDASRVPGRALLCIVLAGRARRCPLARRCTAPHAHRNLLVRHCVMLSDHVNANYRDLAQRSLQSGRGGARGSSCTCRRTARKVRAPAGPGSRRTAPRRVVVSDAGPTVRRRRVADRGPPTYRPVDVVDKHVGHTRGALVLLRQQVPRRVDGRRATRQRVVVARRRVDQDYVPGRRQHRSGPGFVAEGQALGRAEVSIRLWLRAW